MQQYKSSSTTRKDPSTVIEDVQARADNQRIAQRLQWTESLVEQQRRELRRLTAELNTLREFVNHKLKR